MGNASSLCVCAESHSNISDGSHTLHCGHVLTPGEILKLFSCFFSYLVVQVTFSSLHNITMFLLYCLKLGI